MRTLKLTIAYDGTRFVGWQRQGDGESIQRLIEQALSPFQDAGAGVHGAGRTDAGVHALGQVASARVTCSHDTATLVRALNARLPADIRVLAVEDAGPAFHARFSARGKTYRYQIRNAPIVSPFERLWVWHVPEPLSVAAMNAGAACLVGTHDFAAFRSTGTELASTVRTIVRSAWRDDDGLLVYEVAGDGFLRHMVRAIVGTLVEVGRGWRSADDVARLLAGGSRGDAGATAPPHGLFLVAVDYD